jgi:hypothetical protein
MPTNTSIAALPHLPTTLASPVATLLAVGFAVAFNVLLLAVAVEVNKDDFGVEVIIPVEFNGIMKVVVGIERTTLEVVGALEQGTTVVPTE